MAKPYLIAVCVGSTLDQRTNNFTLFNLVEEVQTNTAPVDLPLEVHAYYQFDEAERGREHELRVALISTDDGGIWHSRPVPIVSQHRRHRVRLQGLHFPAFGLFAVFSEVRAREGERETKWERSLFAWPILVRELPREAEQGEQVEQAG